MAVVPTQGAFAYCGVADTDGDSVGDGWDNCPSTPNQSQRDWDYDMRGDACDPVTDRDRDGVPDEYDNCEWRKNSLQVDQDDDGLGDACDNCVGVSNTGQADHDWDGLGDACDLTSNVDGDAFPDLDDSCPYTISTTNLDVDGDGVGDACDNCPEATNPDQSDRNWNGLGDPCDPDHDYDWDGVEGLGLEDNCPAVWNQDQADIDSDGVGDACDNCPAVANPDQADSNLDWVGDACPENQWEPDSDGVFGDADNCPWIYNSSQDDADGDEVGDACDNCASFANFNQIDMDCDQVGDVCDSQVVVDGDSDGLPDPEDLCPTRWGSDNSDRDGDGLGGACDNCPFDANPDQEDVDSDGRGDVCDVLTDRDNDTWPDAIDDCPTMWDPTQSDGDLDGVGDPCDRCPLTPDPLQLDGDGDFVGDACDSMQDRDGDWIPDEVDVCPGVSDAHQADTDGDGVGDACDNCVLLQNTDQHDSHGDGWGDACQTSLDVDADGVMAAEDCDDADPLRSPLFPEYCDGLDNDCDTDVDEGVPESSCPTATPPGGPLWLVDAARIWPLGSGVHVVTRIAFEAAIARHDWAAASKDAQERAVWFASLANHASVLGVTGGLVQLAGSQTITGQVFLVVDNPVAYQGALYADKFELVAMNVHVGIDQAIEFPALVIAQDISGAACVGPNCASPQSSPGGESDGIVGTGGGRRAFPESLAHCCQGDGAAERVCHFAPPLPGCQGDCPPPMEAERFLSPAWAEVEGPVRAQAVGLWVADDAAASEPPGGVGPSNLDLLCRDCMIAYCPDVSDTCTGDGCPPPPPAGDNDNPCGFNDSRSGAQLPARCVLGSWNPEDIPPECAAFGANAPDLARAGCALCAPGVAGYDDCLAECADSADLPGRPLAVCMLLPPDSPLCGADACVPKTILGTETCVPRIAPAGLGQEMVHAVCGPGAGAGGVPFHDDSMDIECCGPDCACVTFHDGPVAQRHCTSCTDDGCSTTDGQPVISIAWSSDPESGAGGDPGGAGGSPFPPPGWVSSCTSTVTSQQMTTNCHPSQEPTPEPAPPTAPPSEAPPAPAPDPPPPASTPPSGPAPAPVVPSTAPPSSSPAPGSDSPKTPPFPKPKPEQLHGDDEDNAPKKLMDPVIVGDGSLDMNVADLSFPAANGAFEFRRQYNSHSDGRGLLGSNWTHNFEVYVEPILEDSDGEWIPPACRGWGDGVVCALVHYGDGSERLFYKDQRTANFLPQAGSVDTLVRATNGWILRSPDGLSRFFNAEGYLVVHRDRFGNGFEVEYEPTPNWRLYLAHCAEEPGTPLDQVARRREAPGCIVLRRALQGIRLTELDAARLAAHPNAPFVWDPDANDGPLDPEADDAEAALSQALALADPDFRASYGARRLRPRHVTDTLGRVISFGYYGPNSGAGTGLLHTVDGPAGTHVEFSYDRPQNYPVALHESFLTEVVRVDGTPPIGMQRALDRFYRYEYQWPGGLATSTYEDYADAVEESYLRFFGAFLGCLEDRNVLDLCFATDDQQSSGNPCIEARKARLRYVSSIADNLVRVTRTGTPAQTEVVTAFSPDPFGQTYRREELDRVVAQWFGTDKNEANLDPSGDDLVAAWARAGLPKFVMRFAESGGSVDDLGWLAPADPDLVAIQLLYPLEPAGPDQDDIWQWNGGGPFVAYGDAAQPLALPACDSWSLDLTSPGTCRADRLAIERGNLPGQRQQHVYRPLHKLLSQEELRAADHPKLYRSRVDCGTLAGAQFAEPDHNDSVPIWVTARPYSLEDIASNATGPCWGRNSDAAATTGASAVVCDLPGSGPVVDEGGDPVRVGDAVLTYGSSWSDTINGRVGRFQNEFTAGGRGRVEADLRRICGWARTVDRDGRVEYRGLNFRGNVLVQLRGSGEEARVQETTYTADGLPREVRAEVSLQQPWTVSDGFTRYTYDERHPTDNGGWDRWLPGFWKRRQNVLKVEEVAAGGSVVNTVLGAGGLQTGSVTGRYQEFEYEQAFNQVTRAKSGAMGGPVMWETRIAYDTMELSPLALATMVEAQPDMLGTILRDAANLPSALDWQVGGTFSQDLNGDGRIGAFGEAAVGLGLPVRIKSGNPEDAQSLSVTNLSWNHAGRIAATDTLDGERVEYEYYLVGDTAGAAAAPNEPPGPSEVGSGGAGQLARITRFAVTAGVDAPAGPALSGGCPSLAPQFRGLLGEECQEPTAELSTQLHLPETVIAEILAASAADTVGESTAFRYNEAGNLKRVFRSDGSDVSYVRDTDGRAWGEIDSDMWGVVRNFTPEGWMARETQWGSAGLHAERGWKYDSEGRWTAACEALVAGGCADIAAASDEDLATSADRLISKTEYSGEGLVSRTLDPTGLETRYLRDTLGRVVGIQRRVGPEVLSTVTLAYDPESGMVASRADGRAQAETFVYDGLRRLRTRRDDRGTSWQLGYDPLDRLTAARTSPVPFGQPDPAIPAWERHTAYDGHGLARQVVENGLSTLLETTHAGQVISVTAPGEGRRDAAYDRTGRPVVTRDAEGTLTVSLWDAGTRTQTVATVRRGLETEPLTTTVRETFDPLGRLVSRETIDDGTGDDRLEQLETWEYTGLTVTHTAPDGHQDVEVTNLAGMPVASHKTAADGAWESTTYAYGLGGFGHVVQVQEPNGEWTTRTYDAMGSMTAEERPGLGPNGAVWVYDYDGWGREVARHDPDGDTVFSCYDAAGDLEATRSTPCDGAAAALLSTFEAYDDLGRATRATRWNVGGDAVTTERDFDPQGRVVRDALQVGGAAVSQVTSNWSAVATGWNRSVVYPTGAQWTRSKDQIGRLVALSGPQGNDIALMWQGEFYAGRSHTRGGSPALDESATLDGLGRRIGWDFTAGSAHAYKAEAARDVVGRIASLTWGVGPSAAEHWRGYGYDLATRLSDAWTWDGTAPAPDVSTLVNHDVGPGQVSLLAGGLAGVVHMPFTRAAEGGDLLNVGDAYEVTSPRGPGHRLTALEVDGVAVTVDHDATGRVVEVDPGYTFEYDPDERLLAVRDSGTGDIVERYAYDAYGRLAATYDADGLTQRFAWDGAQMVAARDGNGVAKWDAIWGTLDQILSWRDLAAHPAGDVAVLPITDHRNSVVGAVESDASGTTLLAGADYTPMGRVASLDPANDDAETCREDGNPGTRCAHPGGMPFGFAGAWRSEATGLVYMRFRWYSPTLAQFLTPDPMGEVDSWNLYAYVGGDPINRWDPWGLDASSMADSALEGEAPVKLSDHGGEPPYGRGWSDAAQEAYERSERLDGGRQPKAPMVGQTLGELVDVTPQVAPVIWMMWFAPPGVGPKRPPLSAPKSPAAAPKSPTKAGPKACMGPGCICFTAGTPVLMADGTTKLIEEIQAGDEVLADDPGDDQPPRAEGVLETHVTLASTIYSVRLEGIGEVIESTSRHPFWTQRGWVAAEELEFGDLLMDSEGCSVAIESIVAESRDVVAYNLTVNEFHTFFVLAGEVAVLVHNVDPWDILFTQSNYGSTFAEGKWEGKTVDEAVDAARKLGRLPDGLTLKAVRLEDGRWATLNNRTLAVAREANLLNVNPVDAGDAGQNKFRKLLKDSGLAGPVENAVMRCK